MMRRDFLKAFGVGGSIGALGRARVEAEEQQPAPDAVPRAMVGSLDLSQIEVIDTHVHPTAKITLSQSYEKQLAGMANLLMPSGEFDGRAEMQKQVVQASRDHQFGLPRRIGYFNYVSRVHGVPPTAAGFDSVLQKYINGDFTGYIRSILDREKISKVVYQVRQPESAYPTTDFPPDRIVWTFPLIGPLQPAWAKKQGATSLGDVVQALDRTMEACAANKCVGFKSAVANYRPLSVAQVSQQDADAALKKLLSTEPTLYADRSGELVPFYNDPSMTDTLKVYQDYLLKHVCIKAGQLDRVILIHTAVAFNPYHRPALQDPAGLYTIFEDDDVKKAGTRFVLLHTGFPNYHTTASIVSQFPNVFVDLSFFSKFPGTLEETLRTLVSLAPSRQIMHGGDSNDVPEEIAYCAWNTKQALARILTDFKQHYGYRESDCATIATDVLSASAKRAFKIA